jgi:hypothetical protein
MVEGVARRADPDLGAGDGGNGGERENRDEHGDEDTANGRRGHVSLLRIRPTPA